MKMAARGKHSEGGTVYAAEGGKEGIEAAIDQARRRTIEEVGTWARGDGLIMMGAPATNQMPPGPGDDVTAFPGFDAAASAEVSLMSISPEPFASTRGTASLPASAAQLQQQQPHGVAEVIGLEARIVAKIASVCTPSGARHGPPAGRGLTTASAAAGAGGVAAALAAAAPQRNKPTASSVAAAGAADVAERQRDQQPAAVGAKDVLAKKPPVPAAFGSLNNGNSNLVGNTFSSRRGSVFKP